MTETIDLLDSDEDEFPSLSARLQQKRGSDKEARDHPRPSSGLGGTQLAPPGAAAGSPRLPLSSLQAAPKVDALLAGAEALRRRQQERAERKAAKAAAATAAEAAAAAAASQEGADGRSGGWQGEELARQQYHGQEAWPQPGSQLDAMPGAPARRRTSGAGQPSRQASQQPWEQPSWQQPQQQQQRDGDGAADDEEDWPAEDWQPAAAAGPSRRKAPAGSGAGGGEAPAKKARRAKRTPEEIERDKILQAQQREDKKRMRQAGAAKYALQQVRLAVDSALLSASGGGGSLGIAMLGHLNDYNSGLSEAAKAEKAINHVVAPLDLAPYKALRWQRRRLVGGGASQQPVPASQASGVAGSQLEERWEQLPHIMVCFEPQEFVEAVLRDRLSPLLALLAARAPAHRPYILVQQLGRHVATHDNRGYQADMRGGAQAGGAPPAPVQRSVRVVVEEFIGELAVRCPRLGFRDVADAAQAAEHVRLITAAIAQEPFRDNEAAAWLRGNDKSKSTSLTNLLITHPVADRQQEALLRAITAVPSVAPPIAHVLASRYGSLGGLMDFLLDPSRSDADKQREIADCRRVGGQERRVGPAAAKQLLHLLRCRNPDLKIKMDAQDD